jgi:hypothetical protein
LFEEVFIWRKEALGGYEGLRCQKCELGNLKGVWKSFEVEEKCIKPAINLF